MRRTTQIICLLAYFQSHILTLTCGQNVTLTMDMDKLQNILDRQGRKEKACSFLILEEDHVTITNINTLK